jgi:tricorn protease
MLLSLIVLFNGSLAAAPPSQLTPDADLLLMRHPTVNKTHVVFSFAGDLWSVPRSGGAAVRLTSSPGIERTPHFSPDGRTIAFSGEYDGNIDVFVMPAQGGIPKRLTYQPTADYPVGWTPDGRSVITQSGHTARMPLPQLFTVPVEGGLPKMLPFPSGSAGSFSPDSGQIAYVPGVQWQDSWKRYRGGQTFAIWIGQMADSKVQEIPRKNSNDMSPMWMGDKVYFLSDRAGSFSLYSYDVASKSVREELKNEGFDFKAATAGAGVIAIEQLGGIKIYDPSTRKVEKVKVTISGDFPEVRPQFKNVAASISNASISPSGARALFESRGDIFTAPVNKGDIRNLTQSSGAADRMPSWSPDGQSIAYLSDASGEYKLVIRNADGTGTPRSITLGESPAYYYNPNWSPDSKKIAYIDNRHNIWYVDLENERSTKVDTWLYETPLLNPQPAWSPDSKWLTYQRQLENHINAVFLYSLETSKVTQVTDGLSDARFPIFDLSGKYLYFVASTNAGRAAAWLDLSSFDAQNILSSIYVVVLKADEPSPLLPESDEERGPGQPDPKKEKQPFQIDLDRLNQRILALPAPSRNYVGLLPGTAGTFFAAEVGPLASVTSAPVVTLHKWNMTERALAPFASNITSATTTPDGSKILIQRGQSWAITPTAAPPQPGQGTVSTAGMQARVDPREEWMQMSREIMRIQRDFFYDPNHHGVNLKKLAARYEPFLANVMSRDDLNYLWIDMLGELSVGHMYIVGGDVPGVRGVPGGLLGADYEIVNNRYRFSRIYDGENWNPELRAPLTQPGVDVRAGEYLLAINGKNITAQDNIYAALEATANRQVRLKVGPNPSDEGSREVIVVPVASEGGLRHRAWVEDNRRTVDRLSGGKVGYVHVPNTSTGGYTSFNRYYFAQIGKQGMVIDERFNGGGMVDDYMVEAMARPLMSMWTTRYGKDFTSPLAAVFGPKVMLINQYAGSGGDYFPWHFRQRKLGPIVGKRTWGGLVGILVFPNLVDGGYVTSPNLAFYNPNGTWEIEGHGVPPDIDVELDPYLWRQGRDSQLERAVEEAMKLIATTPVPQIKKPAYPDKSKLPPGG